MLKKVFNIIVSIVFILLLFCSIRNTAKSYEYRRHLDTVREQLIRTEEYNRKLAERFGSISANVQKLGELADRNVNGVRQCIEIIEETRVIIKEMEDSIYGSDSIDNYYSYWDSYYHDEQLMD